MHLCSVKLTHAFCVAFKLKLGCKPAQVFRRFCFSQIKSEAFKKEFRAVNICSVSMLYSLRGKEGVFGPAFDNC